MYVLKAFAPHSSFVNNTKGVVSKIGEISTQSLTSAREKGLYRSDISSEISLITFTAILDGSPVPLTTAISDHVIKICKFIYDKTISTHNGKKILN